MKLITRNNINDIDNYGLIVCKTESGAICNILTKIFINDYSYYSWVSLSDFSATTEHFETKQEAIKWMFSIGFQPVIFEGIYFNEEKLKIEFIKYLKGNIIKYTNYM